MKSGSRPIQGVLEYPQHAAGCKGLWIKDTPGREPEILQVWLQQVPSL